MLHRLRRKSPLPSKHTNVLPTHQVVRPKVVAVRGAVEVEEFDRRGVAALGKEVRRLGAGLKGHGFVVCEKGMQMDTRE